MPNWCYTSIVINHNDKVKLEDLADKIAEWSHKQFCDTGEFGFRDGWLGNIVGNSGVGDPMKDDCPRCRGTLTSIYFENGQINMSTETAWAPMMQMWQMIVDKYLPNADIWYTAEEPGNCIYESNDPDVIGKYCIDVWETPNDFKEAESIWEATEEETREFLQRALKTDETDIKKLINMSSEVIDDAWFSVNEWEECDISVY